MEKSLIFKYIDKNEYPKADEIYNLIMNDTENFIEAVIDIANKKESLTTQQKDLVRKVLRQMINEVKAETDEKKHFSMVADWIKRMKNEDPNYIDKLFSQVEKNKKGKVVWWIVGGSALLAAVIITIIIIKKRKRGRRRRR